MPGPKFFLRHLFSLIYVLRRGQEGGEVFVGVRRHDIFYAEICFLNWSNLHPTVRLYRVYLEADTVARDGSSPMITIRLTTWVDAPVERCFLLAANTTQVQAHGLPQIGDTISWQIRPAGVLPLSYTSRIDTVRPFSYFRDTMVSGLFRRYECEHYFAAMDDGTRIREEIQFAARMGPLGRLLGTTVLRLALKKMLMRRHSRLKRIAESTEWQKYIEPGVAGSSHETIPVAESQRQVPSVQRFA